MFLGSANPHNQQQVYTISRDPHPKSPSLIQARKQHHEGTFASTYVRQSALIHLAPTRTPDYPSRQARGRHHGPPVHPPTHNRPTASLRAHSVVPVVRGSSSSSSVARPGQRWGCSDVSSWSQCNHLRKFRRPGRCPAPLPLLLCSAGQGSCFCPCPRDGARCCESGWCQLLGRLLPRLLLGGVV
ncbi:uncharacterized protein K452DRAFT_44220 [Aplosporella prunicola CBS 121167]|uniref:Uncharacterized protein n=1 Tax=Aplosporella prunicola CBS 121167 TaxID=1176127 RepID=A0A6A6BCL7_9PEZI|nr:uncharacterized protein K452DRAFT_44220 [Aplosporella prunicola CBS 121167]KAF2141025.1 hypothetical protein K452DRAFT_44220 [Aplosporella prunicola CBS 121167]